MPQIKRLTGQVKQVFREKGSSLASPNSAADGLGLAQGTLKHNPVQIMLWENLNKFVK